MIEIKEITDFKQIYSYYKKLNCPYFFETNFASWQKSFMSDIDGNGNALFKTLFVKGAFENNKLIGFIQYGISSFGFTENGDISHNITYPIIRNLFFDKKNPEAGERLLQVALDFFENSNTIYAFFHYFGMSCYARHGKLFEKYVHVETLLQNHGFVIEHKNVYYSLRITKKAPIEVSIVPHNLTNGNQQGLDFLIDNSQVGGCEIHFVNNKIAYLRWIYINNDITGQGIGSKCMIALNNWLVSKGITQLDADTSISNEIAQHYYLKNNFICKGKSKSFYKHK